MPFAARALVLGLLILSAAGCGGSNNKSKIEGAWKFAPGTQPDAKLQGAVFSFGGGGDVMLQLPGAPKPAEWRYKLLAGDGADFYGLSPDAAARGGLFPTAPDDGGTVRVTIRIEVLPGAKYQRHAMTITDAQGQALHLVRTRD